MRVLFPVEPFQVEPLGIAYLAASIKKHGHEARLVKTDKEFLQELSSFKPHVVAFSVTTGKHLKFLSLAREIKKHFNTLTVFGGSHPTYFPEVSFDPSVDVTVRGEADKSFPELLGDLERHKPVNRVINFRSLEQEIGRLPFPDREFLYRYAENRDNAIKNVITSRGCRFACPYCFNSLYRQFYKGENWVRFRLPDNIIEECIQLKKYPLKMVFFQDDEFLSNPHLTDFLCKYKTKVGVPFHCQIRIELLTEAKAELLRDAGCTGVTFAIECGDPVYRKEVLNRNMTDKQILEGAHILHKFGLKFRTENMVGLPGENILKMLTTLKLNADCRPTIAWASIFQPYPRLPLTEYALKNGFWDGKGVFDESFFESSMLTNSFNKEIVNIQRLFGLAACNSLVHKFINKLIKLPNNKIYDKISSLVKSKGYRKLYA